MSTRSSGVRTTLIIAEDRRCSSSAPQGEVSFTHVAMPFLEITSRMLAWRAE
jgi:hypothetical protein